MFSQSKVSKKKVIVLAAVCAFSLSFARQVSALDVDASYQTTWVDPHQRSVLTAQRGELKAELTRNQPIFSDSPEKYIGGLKIFLNDKSVYEDYFLKEQRAINGPWLSKDKALRTVFIDLMRPDVPYDYSETDTVYGYHMDAQTRKVTKSVSKALPVDTEQANEKTVEVRDSEYADVQATLSCDIVSADSPTNWQLVIKKGDKVVFSGNPTTPDVSSDMERWNPPRCYGPFVTSLDGSGNAQVVLYVEPVMTKGSGESTFYRQKIYYFDDASQTEKVVTTSFGEDNPRFLSIGKSAAMLLACEDWSLENDIWQGSAGPLQIWKWDQNKLINVAKDYPDEIRKHAKGSLARFLSDRSTNDKADCWLIGYVGDLCLLGESTKALTELDVYKTARTEKAHDQIIEQLKKHGYL